MSRSGLRASLGWDGPSAACRTSDPHRPSVKWIFGGERSLTPQTLAWRSLCSRHTELPPPLTRRSLRGGEDCECGTIPTLSHISLIHQRQAVKDKHIPCSVTTAAQESGENWVIITLRHSGSGSNPNHGFLPPIQEHLHWTVCSRRAPGTNISRNCTKRRTLRRELFHG